MTTLSPDSRPLTAQTDNGDTFIVSEFHSHERLDGLFEHKALVLAPHLDEKAMLGQGVSFCYQPGHDTTRTKERFFHGHCLSIRQTGILDSRDYRQYEIVAAPWPCFLSLRKNCRIFQQQTVKDMVQTLAQEHGCQSSLKIHASSDQQKPFCMQFNESDWDFLQRHIQAQGWFYCFQQEEGQHTLVINDSNQQCQDSGEKEVEYFIGSHKLQRAIHEWSHGYQIQPGSVVTADYDYEQAQVIMADETRTRVSNAHSTHLQYFYYPGDFQSRQQGNTVSSLGMKGFDSNVSVVTGAGSLCHFASGTTFDLDHHPDSEEQQRWLLTEVTHDMITAEDGHSIEYSNRFRCIPANTPWKTRQTVPKPVMAGLHSAVVTGPENQEICLDKHHRIKVKFHWDREAKDDQNSSCWVRVAQPMTGDGFGCQFTPRVGDEVVISFLDGDPDKPLVVGTVYNGKRQQPYSNGLDQGFRMKSLPGAGAENFSELRFGCKKGQELLYLQAEKDLSVVVKNDAERKVTGNETAEIDKSSDRMVKENDTHTIQGTLSTNVSKGIVTKTDADYRLESKQDMQQQSGGSYSLQTRGTTTLNSDGDLKLDTGQNLNVTASGNQSLKANSISAKGNTGVELSVGASKIALSTSSIELSCGGSSIKLSPASLAISGVQLSVEGQTSALLKGGVSTSVESGVNTQVKGTMVTINGQAITTVKAGALVELSGAIAKIN